MNNIKQYLLEFIWGGDNISNFEQWLYKQNSTEFENLLGEQNRTYENNYDPNT